MYWVRRPPIGRWLAAVLLIAVGLVSDLRAQPTSEHPFLGTDVAAGDVITDLEWRRVPAGMFPVVDGLGLVARVDLKAGSPLIPEVLGSVAAPAGWWSLVIEVPSFLAPGTRLALLHELDGEPVEGILLATSRDELAYGPSTGLVAVAPEGATAVARANLEDTLVVLLLPG